MTSIGDSQHVVMGSDGKYYAKSSGSVAVGDTVQVFIGSDGKYYASKSGTPSVGSQVLVSIDSTGKYIAHVSSTAGCTRQIRYVYDPYTSVTSVDLPGIVTWGNEKKQLQTVVDSNKIPHVFTHYSNYFAHWTKIAGVWTKEVITAATSWIYLSWKVEIDTNDLIHIVYQDNQSFTLYRTYGSWGSWTNETVSTIPFTSDGSNASEMTVCTHMSGTTLYVVITNGVSTLQNLGYQRIWTAIYSGSWTVADNNFQIYGYCNGLQLRSGELAIQTWRYSSGVFLTTFMRKHPSLGWIEYLSYPLNVVGHTGFQYFPIYFSNKVGRSFIINAAGTTISADWRVQTTVTWYENLFVYDESGNNVGLSRSTSITAPYVYERLTPAYTSDYDLLQYTSQSGSLQISHLYGNAAPTEDVITIESDNVKEASMSLDSDGKYHVAYLYCDS